MMFNYLTTEPLPDTLITPICDTNGIEIAIWTSTNGRLPFDEAEVEAALQWAVSGDKYLEIRKEVKQK